MDKFSSDGVDRDYYSAYVIENGEFTAQLVAAFADYKPKVVMNIQISNDKGEARNKATGKLVQLCSVKVHEIKGNNATVYVTWYSAPEGAGGHTIQLQKKDGKWTVESEKMDWVS